jgi:addiction module RelE/StbE family toxin
MRASYHKDFKKAYRKLSGNLKQKANERILLFLEEPFNPLLNNHALAGKYLGYRSINVTGDFRAVYKLLDSDIAHFVDLNTHSNLYK